MPLRRAASAIRWKIEQGHQEQLDKGIPADRLKNQLPPTALPPASSSARGGVLLSDATPAADGSADPGVSADASRGDHVHPTSGGAITVLDGGTTVNPTTTLRFPSGTVVDNGSGEAAYVPTGGGTIGSVPLDNRTLHATYGDHFIAASLDAKWTRHNLSSGEEAYQIRDGSYLRAALWGGSADKQYHQTAPSGDFEIQMKVIVLGPSQQVLGPMIIDSSGNGVLASFNTTDNIFVIWTLAAYAYSGNIGTVAERNVGGLSGVYGAIPIWFALRKVGTTYSGRWSVDGIAWSSYLTGSPTQGFTVDRIGFGRALNTNSSWMDVDWFDVV